MRISDWSSDVCSSDLRDPHRPGRMALPGRPAVRDLYRPDLDAGGRRPALPAPPAGGLEARDPPPLPRPPDRLDPLVARRRPPRPRPRKRSEENTSELKSIMRISYAVFCLKKQKSNN